MRLRVAPPTRRYVRDLFSGSAVRVVRWLLIEPERAWSVSEMSARAHVTIGFVSRIFATLERDVYVVRSRGETRLKASDELLDAWTRAPQPLETVIEGVSLARPGAVLKRIAELERSDYVLTAEAAAEQLSPFSRLNKVELYVKDFGNWQQELQLTPVPVGANVRLIRSEDKGIFDGAIELRDLRIASLPQVYVDLKRREGSAPEAAAFLRQRFDKLRRTLAPTSTK